MTVITESRTALREMIDMLSEIDRRWASAEWNLHSPADIVAAHRSLLHTLEGGLHSMFETNPARPEFRRIVTPSRKFTGDNSDAIYFDAPISVDYAYRICGNMHGAVYFSLTLEADTASGAMASKTVGVLNDTAMDIASDGSFEVYLGGAPHTRNWLALDAAASRVTTRHYFEMARCAAADPACEPLLIIEALAAGPAPAAPDDSSVAAGIRRVTEFVRSRTLGMPPMAKAVQPPFVALTPNQFPKPVVPGDFGLAAFDAHYSMAPYFLNADEALVITGRWPQCRFANVCLWNRFQQTYDYANRQVSLNRTQTELDADGHFHIIIAHQDPGLPNWIDTEGQLFGLVFWRFMLAEGEVETPQAEVVKFDMLKS